MPARRTNGPAGKANFPAGLAKPALRALDGAGLTHLAQLRKISEAKLLELHGMGPNAIRKLREALREHGWSFAKD